MNITNITTANMQLQEKLNIIRDRYQQRHCHGYSHSQYQHPIRTVVNIDSSRASVGGVGVVSNGYHKRKYSLNLGEYKYVTSTSTPTPPPTLFMFIFMIIKLSLGPRSGTGTGTLKQKRTDLK